VWIGSVEEEVCVCVYGRGGWVCVEEEVQSKGYLALPAVASCTCFTSTKVLALPGTKALGPWGGGEVGAAWVGSVVEGLRGLGVWWRTSPHTTIYVSSYCWGRGGGYT